MGDLFFVLAKSFWMLARPDTVLLAMVLLGLALRWLGWLRGGRALIGAALALFIAVGLWPVQSLVLAPLETRFPSDPQVADVAGVILLGGSEDLAATARSGRPQVNQGGDRYLATLDLARRYPDAVVVFAGGGAQLRTSGGEARVARALLTAGGIAADRLRIENRSRDTYENAIYAKALVAGAADGRWLLVTSAAHMPRAFGTFCAAGWRGLVPYPVDHRASSVRLGWNPSGNLYELHAALREWAGLVAYRVAGRTAVLFPEACDAG